MSSLADIPELVGFFSYSREDDDDSHGALSALRDRIQRELRGQLGRTMKTFRLWQDKEAIAPGTLWESEIKNAVGQAVFFIPIITPTVVRSPYCKFELESFLAREAELGRRDLVFPILYIRVPELEDRYSRGSDPVLSIIAKRQYLDWRDFRHRDVSSADIKTEIERFAATICDALRRTGLSPGEQQRQAAAAAQRRSDETRQMTGLGEAASAAAIPLGGSNGLMSTPSSPRVAIQPAVSAAAWRFPGRALAIGGLAVIATALIAVVVMARLLSGTIASAPNVAPGPTATTAPRADVPAPPSTPAPAQNTPAPAATTVVDSPAQASPVPPNQGGAGPAAVAPEPAPPAAAATPSSVVPSSTSAPAAAAATSSSVAPPSTSPSPAPQAHTAPRHHRPYRY